jgi:hypothetical protein
VPDLGGGCNLASTAGLRFLCSKGTVRSRRRSLRAVEAVWCQSREEILMRILALAILTMATASAAPSARAQTYDPKYPVCLQVYQGWNDYYFECGYTSLAQCNMSASGRAAQCIINPYYAGAKASPGRRERRHRRVY